MSWIYLLLAIVLVPILTQPEDWALPSQPHAPRTEELQRQYFGCFTATYYGNKSAYQSDGYLWGYRWD